MELSEDEILKILKIIDESEYDELRLETDELKLVLKKKGGAPSIQESCNAGVRQISPGSDKPVISSGKVQPEARKASPATPTLVHPEDGLVPVKAPVLGIFYRSPSPGAPPFVEEGTSVKENDTVCIIEVMKVFNSVPAGESGVIVKVCPQNGQTVEYGQTLFLIRPDREHKG